MAPRWLFEYLTNDADVTFHTKERFAVLPALRAKLSYVPFGFFAKCLKRAQVLALPAKNVRRGSQYDGP